MLRSITTDELMDTVSPQCRNATLSVLLERHKQNKKWGEQNHDAYRWITILMEEVGEVSQAVLQSEFGGDKGGQKNVHDEMVQVAAVALAMVECCNRNRWGSK